MEVHEAMKQVSRLLCAHKHSVLVMPALYVKNHQLAIIPLSSHPTGGLVVTELKHQDFSEGLNSEKWDLVESKIRKLIKEKVL